MLHTIKNIVQEKCPNCESATLFKSKGNIFLFKLPVMYKSCPNCGKTTEKEPGYYTGAMYVSYGLAIVEILLLSGLLFVCSVSGFDVYMYVTIATLVILSTFNFRISRMIWLYFI